MAKMLNGVVVSTAMTQTVVVEVTTQTPHPLYRKLLKRSKKYKVALDGNSVQLGDIVRIIETKPKSKGKYFTIAEVAVKQGKPGVVSPRMEINSQIAKTVLASSTKKTTRRKVKKEANDTA